MKEVQSWSLSVGRWGNVSLRLHMLFLLAVIVIFGAEWNVGATNINFFYGTAAVTLVSLLGAVVIHQVARAFAIKCLGADVHEIEFMPWGGNCVSDLDDSTRLAPMAHAAGLFANGMLFLMGYALLCQIDQFTAINPFRPQRFDAGNAQVSALRIFSWVNFQLMLVNLIPCHPFDGAKIIRSTIANFKLPLTKYRTETAIMLIGHAFAFALIGTGIVLMVRNYEPGIRVAGPAWGVLLIAGVTLFFSARFSMFMETSENEEYWEGSERDEFGFGFDAAETTADDDRESLAYSQWLSEKQQERRRFDVDREFEEDSWADRVLEKLHANGGDLECLTGPEQGVLNRFSERVRRRREQGVTESS